MAIDVMIDLETTGVEAGCCVLAIGACTLNGEETFYETISHEDSLSKGLIDNPETLAWWSKQSEEARREAFIGVRPVIVAAGDFANWMLKIEKKYGEVFVWGNGADFDLPILSAMYAAVGMKKPWKPFNGRCYRTFKNLPAHKAIKPDAFQGIKHNAVADAYHQAHHMMKILNKLKEI